MFNPPPPGPNDAGPPAKSPEQQDDALLAYVLQCLEKGSKPADVRKQLIAQGMSKEEANQVVQAVVNWRSQHYSKEGINVADPDSIHAAGKRNMAIGGIICLIGIIVTVLTFSAASSGGGRFVVAWGAIVFGAIQFFRGLGQMNTGRPG